MTTHDVLAAEPARSPGVEAVVDAFIALQETNRATELAEVLTDDAVLDSSRLYVPPAVCPRAKYPPARRVDSSSSDRQRLVDCRSSPW